MNAKSKIIQILKEHNSCFNYDSGGDLYGVPYEDFDDVADEILAEISQLHEKEELPILDKYCRTCNHRATEYCALGCNRCEMCGKFKPIDNKNRLCDDCEFEFQNSHYR